MNVMTNRDKNIVNGNNDDDTEEVIDNNGNNDDDISTDSYKLIQRS